MSRVLSLREHEVRSLRKWLHSMAFEHPDDPEGQRIFVERPRFEITRPAMKIEEIPGGMFEDRGRLMGARRVSYQITVMGTSKWSTERQVAEIVDKALRTELIPLYLWGWEYPTPTVSVVAGGGSLPAGQVSVRVSAVNDDGHESLASTPVVVAAAAGDGLKVLITPWPRSAPVAKEYRVFAGATGSEKLADVIPALTGGVPSVALVGAVPPAGDPVKESSSFFARFMRVRSVSDMVLEHPSMEGPHDGNVQLDLEYTTVRIPVAVQAEAVDDVQVSSWEVASG